MNDYKSYLEKLISGSPINNPFLEFLGIQVEEIREGYAKFSLEIKPEFLQGAGIMQGGLSIALSSEAAAHAAMTTLAPDEGIATIELKNNFLSPVSRGRIIAEATLFKRGKTLIIVDCMVRDEQGKNISRSSATLMVIAKTSRQ